MESFTQNVITSMCKNGAERKEVRAFLDYVKQKGYTINENDVVVLCETVIQNVRGGAQSSLFGALKSHVKEASQDKKRLSKTKGGRGYCYKSMNGSGKKLIFTKKGQANYTEDKRRVVEKCKSDGYGELSPTCPTRKEWEKSISNCD